MTTKGVPTYRPLWRVDPLAMTSATEDHSRATITADFQSQCGVVAALNVEHTGDAEPGIPTEIQGWG